MGVRSTLTISRDKALEIVYARISNASNASLELILELIMGEMYNYTIVYGDGHPMDENKLENLAESDWDD